MTKSRSVIPAKVPLHLWLVGILAVLWNGVGAFDYLMTETRNPSYLGSFTAEQIAYFNSMPKWAIATWAIAVWGGLLGGILILLRKRLAVQVLAVSLVSATATFFYNFVLSNGLQAMGGAAALVMPGVVLVIAVILLLYSRHSTRSGALQ